MAKFEIPVNVVVEADTEAKAELQVLDLLKEADREFGKDHRIIDWEYFEFMPRDLKASCKC